MASGGGDGCNPGLPSNQANRHDGESRYLGAGVPDGVMAVEKNYSPWVDPSQPIADASGWVMLVDNTGKLYSQFGWIEFAGGVRHLFSEVGNATNPLGHDFNRQFYYPTPAINSQTTVEVSYQPNNSYKYDYYANGARVGGDNDSYSQFVPAQAQISGEIWSDDTQMPGGYAVDNSTYQSWTGERVWYPETPGGNWHYFNENFDTAVVRDDNTTFYGYSNYPNAYLDSQYIWDWGCPY